MLLSPSQSMVISDHLDGVLPLSAVPQLLHYSIMASRPEGQGICGPLPQPQECEHMQRSHLAFLTHGPELHAGSSDALLLLFRMAASRVPDLPSVRLFQLISCGLLRWNGRMSSGRGRAASKMPG